MTIGEYISWLDGSREDIWLKFAIEAGASTDEEWERRCPAALREMDVANRRLDYEAQVRFRFVGGA